MSPRANRAPGTGGGPATGAGRPAPAAVAERAPAKVNLVLRLGRTRPDGLHELASLFASIDLADTLTVTPVEGPDRVICPGVEGPNLASAAVAALRAETGGELPGLEVRIDKRIPVAGGLAGGSADAAAALRAGNRLLGEPLAPDELRRLGARLGADVPSQVAPGHALVTGAGEHVEPIALPPMTLVIVPHPEGLLTGRVYAEADRLGVARADLDVAGLRALAGSPLADLVAQLENDLEPAALSLRPQLGQTLERLSAAGALAARITGSGPTAFGVFAALPEAEAAAATIAGAVVASLGGPDTRRVAR